MIILNILIIILIAILMLVLLILFVPFHYDIKITNHEKDFYIGARMHWLFGLFQLAYDNKHLFHVKLFGRLIKIKNGEDKEKKEQQIEVEEKEEKKKKKKRKITKKGVKYLVKCFMNIIRKYRPQKLVVKGKLGFEDPSITGFLQGLTHVFNVPINIDNLEFIYDKKVYNGTIYTNGKIAIYYLVFIFLKLILYRPTRLMLKL